MVDKIIGTFLSRIVVTAVMLGVVIINANAFGAEGTGTIALVILGLTILQLFSNFIGGGALVYLIPRNSIAQIVAVSYCWSFFISMAGVTVLYILHLIPSGFEWLLWILSVTNSFYYINTTIMQGKENIALFNRYQLFQVFMLLGSFLLLLSAGYLLKWVLRVEFYIYALIASYFVPWLFSIRYVVKNSDKFHFLGIGKLIKEMFRFGFWVQLSNLAQLMNYRLNYYFIEFNAGRKPLGIFELGTKLSEVILIFPKSIALVQYAKLANSGNREYASRLTIGLLKIVFSFSFLAVMVLTIIPAKWLAFIFGPEFYEAKTVIYCLAPGIVFLSCLSVCSHYFSGLGKYWVNSLSSLIGLAITLVLGIAFIPKAAAIGYMKAITTAGVITTLSYFSSFVFTFLFFLKTGSVKWKELGITKTDISIFKKEVGSVFRNFKSRKP